MRTQTLTLDILDNYGTPQTLTGVSPAELRIMEPHVIILNSRREQARPVPQDIRIARETYESTGITAYLPHPGWLMRWLSLGELDGGRKLSAVGAMRFLDRFAPDKSDCMEGY